METKEAINRYIHEKILGLCWHDYKPEKCELAGCNGDAHFYKCSHCGCEGSSDPEFREENPNYCSDDSPRRLLNEVVEKVTNDMVVSSSLRDHLDTYDKAETDGHDLMLVAEQIARACVAAHKEQQNEN